MNQPDTWEEYKTFRNRLAEIQKHSGISMCPGCGLTVDALDALFSSSKANWLRSEIEKLEGEKRTRIEWSGTTDEEKNVLLAIFDAHNQALTSIITRYKEELKVLESK